MVVAGALPCALTSADEVRGDRRRLQHHERPHAPMAPDQHHGGWSGIPLVLPQPSLLIVQEIAGDVDGSHRPGFARQPTEIRIVLVALWAAMGIVRLPQELPAMTNLFGAQSPPPARFRQITESRFSFTQEAPFEYAAR